MICRSGNLLMRLNKIKLADILMILILILSFSPLSVYAQDFGKYSLYQNYPNNNINYRAYALNQTLQNNKRHALRRAQMQNYYSNPTRRIQYPSINNPYPNIQRGYGNYGNISARQRSSAQYYQNVYR